MCVLLATEITWQYDLNRKLWACFSAKKSFVFVVNHGSHIGCHNACRWLSLLYSFPDGILTSYSFTCYGTLLGITQTCYAARSSSQNRVLYGEVCMHRTHQPHHVSIIRPGLSTEGIQSDRNVFAVCTLSVNLMCVGNSWAVLLQGWEYALSLVWVDVFSPLAEEEMLHYGSLSLPPSLLLDYVRPPGFRRQETSCSDQSHRGEETVEWNYPRLLRNDGPGNAYYEMDEPLHTVIAQHLACRTNVPDLTQ